MTIESTVRRLLELGIDFASKDTVKSSLELIGSDTKTLDEVYITLKNHINHKAFFGVPIKKRMLFISHCLRKTPGCTAEIAEDGYHCKKCMNCDIGPILEEAERIGYRTLIVPGGSMVFQAVKDYRPKACFGIACYYELEEAIGKLARLGIPTQSVPLSRAGCLNTRVDVERVKKALNGL